jgi:hypothetical protein
MMTSAASSPSVTTTVAVSTSDRAKDNCPNEFEFQNKLRASLSGLTDYYACPSKDSLPHRNQRKKPE